MITSLYPPHAIGGYEATCRDTVERWRASGHRVTVLTSDTRVDGVEHPGEEPHVRRELAFYWVDHALPARSWRARLLMERRNQEALRRALDEVRPHVVSAWSFGALSLGLLSTVAAAGLPLVLVVCDDWLVYGERADLWRRPLAGHRWAARLAEQVTGLPCRWPEPRSAHAVFVSTAVRDAAVRDAPWRPATSAVVGSGIDLGHFPLADGHERPWGWRLLQVGRVDPRKGIAVGLRALAGLPAQATMGVLGRGDERHARELRVQAAELGLSQRVHFDAVPREDLAPHYRQADVLLFLPTWQEPFGLVPLEAMACATPVVATATGGAAEFLVDGENCLVVPPDDPVATAAAVQRLASDAPLRQRLVAAGLETAAGRSVDEYAARLEAEHVAVVDR